MFRITGSLVNCLAKNYKNDSIVSVDMDMIGVMAVYSDPCVYVCVRVCRSLYMKTVPSYTVNCTHTQNRSQYTAMTLTLSMSTDTIEPFL